MTSVFLLWHSYEDDTHEDSKLIGVYTTRELAELAKSRVIVQPGFSLYPNGFLIDEYRLDKDHWAKGFE